MDWMRQELSLLMPAGEEASVSKGATGNGSADAAEMNLAGAERDAPA